MKQKSNIIAVVTLALVCSFIAQQTIQAKQGATDPIPGTSKGGTSAGGGGGGGGKSTTPAPTPTPPTPVSSGILTFTSADPANGSCTGDYQIDPYYPALLDMTLNVHVSSMNVPDGTVLYINVVGTADSLYPLYPYTSNAIVIIGGSGSCLEKVFVTTGAGLAGVVVTDAAGVPVFAGN